MELKKNIANENNNNKVQWDTILPSNDYQKETTNASKHVGNKKELWLIIGVVVYSKEITSA